MGTNTTLTKGGIVAYTTSLDAKVAITYLLNTQTGYYNKDSAVEMMMSFLVGALLGLGQNWAPGAGHVLLAYRGVMLIRSVFTALPWKSASESANGFVRIMNVQDSSGTESSSTLCF